MSIRDQGVCMGYAEDAIDLTSLEDVKYHLFSDLIGENLSPIHCEKKYKLPIDKLRKIVHKDSTVTKEQYAKWVSKGNA